MSTRFLLTSDEHLFNNPADLTPDQMRGQFYPILLTRRWFPRREVEMIVYKLYLTSLTALRRLQDTVGGRCDYHISLGDQCHGISERGIVGEAGLKVARSYLRISRRLTRSGDLFHVPSEHPLGYWEGTDWLFGWRRRKFEGALNLEAISNWRSLFGPLWGVHQVGEFRFVYLTSDLFRWRDRLTGELLQLALEQEEFVQRTIGSANLASVVLFIHRVGYVFDSPVLRQYHSRLRAVVFGDFHHPKVAAKRLVQYGRPEFDLWFVPAVWGVQFGVGSPGYAVLTVDGPDIGLTTSSLGR